MINDTIQIQYQKTNQIKYILAVEGDCSDTPIEQSNQGKAMTQ